VFVKERQRMTDKLEDTSLRLKDEMDLYKKMMDKLRLNRNEFKKERDTMQEVSSKMCLFFDTG